MMCARQATPELPRERSNCGMAASCSAGAVVAASTLPRLVAACIKCGPTQTLRCPGCPAHCSMAAAGAPMEASPAVCAGWLEHLLLLTCHTWRDAPGGAARPGTESKPGQTGALPGKSATCCSAAIAAFAPRKPAKDWRALAPLIDQAPHAKLQLAASYLAPLLRPPIHSRCRRSTITSGAM